jgi:hypothetical protein
MTEAESLRSGRRRRFLTGLAGGNGVGLALFGVVVVSGGPAGADISSSGAVTALVAAATFAPLLGLGVALTRFLSASRREERARSGLARALERAGTASPAELDVRRAAHDVWAAAADAARVARANAGNARRAWQDLVGSARRTEVQRWLAAEDAVAAAEAEHARTLIARDSAEHSPPLVVVGDGHGRVAAAVAGAGTGRPVVVVAPAPLSPPVALRRLARFARRRAS